MEGPGAGAVLVGTMPECRERTDAQDRPKGVIKGLCARNCKLSGQWAAQAGIFCPNCMQFSTLLRLLGTDRVLVSRPAMTRTPDLIHWHPSSWHSKQAQQQATYPDQAALDRVVAELSGLPPLVVSW